MDGREEKIRRRAYELWEEAGMTGAPEDHWLQAEREFEERSPNATAATVESAPPAAAVEAAAAANDSSRHNGNGDRRQGRRSA